jgi:AI-2E family transporter
VDGGALSGGRAFVGHVIEPMLFGHSTGLSPVAVVASATFWTALWGPVGLLLATPLTICLAVLGRHVERFRFLEVMFGDRPALSPSELFYQRLLADDPAEAVDKAEEFLKERLLSTYYDEVALPGLQLAQKDMVRGTLSHQQTDGIKSAVIEVVDDLADHDDRKPVDDTTHNVEVVAAVETVDYDTPELPVWKKEELAPEWRSDTPILCVAGRSPLDEAAAIMLAELLEKHGLPARVEGADAIATTNIFRLDTRGIVMVFLSISTPAAPPTCAIPFVVFAASYPRPKSFWDAGRRMLIPRGFATRRGPMPSRPRFGRQSGSVWKRPAERRIRSQLHRLKLHRPTRICRQHDSRAGRIGSALSSGSRKASVTAS